MNTYQVVFENEFERLTIKVKAETEKEAWLKAIDELYDDHKAMLKISNVFISKF